MSLTTRQLELHDAGVQEQLARDFLAQKLPSEVVERVVQDLIGRKGCVLTQYTEGEIQDIAIEASQGSYRLQLDIGRGLMRMHDGFSIWSSTVSDGASKQWGTTSHLEAQDVAVDQAFAQLGIDDATSLEQALVQLGISSGRQGQPSEPESPNSSQDIGNSDDDSGNSCSRFEGLGSQGSRWVP